MRNNEEGRVGEVLFPWVKLRQGLCKLFTSRRGSEVRPINGLLVEGEETPGPFSVQR